ncbi:peptidase S8 family domain protein [Gregarina niphandrodes]|uniref:subtilisin n=1 Tax=Gregarina niphandrodes TaxID=110365 RepID=A0A023AXQ9_GRENI|nr:peptidase S8 family domain protein [Gregarina niphandrodes]EZG43414.1 peptidase S8 family domain protein [Gregarina niphandrodes]|eukprot:XP_011133355.1 peptidase S8 family domain protein [Gregarina niphandrodes]
MYRGIPSLKWISGFGLDRLSGEAVESDGVSLARQRKRYSKKDDDSTSLPADIFTEARDLPTLFMNGSTAPVFAKSSLQGQQDLASNAIRLPSDALIGKQWYLYGPSQGVEYGANVIDAWAASVLIARKRASGVSFPWHRAASLPPLVGPLDIVGDVGEGAGRGAGELQLAAAPIEFKEVLRAAPGLTVAIADSGCATNEDLVRKLAWSGGCPKKAKTDGFGRCLGYDYGNESPDPTQSTESHGTQTAGLIAAESDNHWGIAATCPNCKLICIKIFNDETRTLSTTAIVRALEHIAKSGAKVSNHSYGGFGDDRLERYAFERLLGKGDHLAFVAAGNAGCNIDCRGKKNCAGKRCPNTQLWTPASYNLPGLISIASNTKKGSVSMFSNVGPSSVQIFTPGSEIVSIDKRGSPTGTVGSGTSFASPIAAGIAAFVWSVIPEATAAQVQNAILTTARHNPQFEGLSRVPGILDAYNVLVKLANLV